MSGTRCDHSYTCVLVFIVPKCLSGFSSKGPNGRPIPRHSGGERMKRPVRHSSESCEETIMQDQRPTIPHQLNSSQVLWRFVLRLLLLTTFATFSTQGFGTTIRRVAVLVGDFLRGRRRDAARGYIWSRADALG